MPSMKICKCGKLIDLNLKMCPDCENRNKKNKQAYEKQRGSASERGYNSTWRRYRSMFLREHPLCEECLKEGRIVPATVVDHIKPHKGNKELFWDSKNHQSLCKHHHDIKTDKEDGGFGNRIKGSAKK